MSIFGDLDLTQAADDPFAIPDNTYECQITKAEAVPKKDGSGKGFQIVYTVTDGPLKNRTISEYKNIPTKAEYDDPANVQAKRDADYLKARLINLGVPAAKVNDVVPADLLGTDVFVTVKNNQRNGQNFANVVNVRRQDA